MGPDYLHLFNKALADEILSMDRESFARFVDLNHAKATDSSVVFWKEREQCSALETIDNLIAKGSDLEEMKRDFVMDIAFETDAEGKKKTIYLDYWGCWAEVFCDGMPEGMIGSASYLNYGLVNDFVLGFNFWQFHQQRKDPHDV